MVFFFRISVVFAFLFSFLFCFFFFHNLYFEQIKFFHLIRNFNFFTSHFQTRIMFYKKSRKIQNWQRNNQVQVYLEGIENLVESMGNIVVTDFFSETKKKILIHRLSSEGSFSHNKMARRDVLGEKKKREQFGHSCSCENGTAGEKRNNNSTTACPSR